MSPDRSFLKRVLSPVSAMRASRGGTRLPYRVDIPGQVSLAQLRAIEAVASLVPEGGCVVEVGSLFGRSSWAWAKSVKQGATVHCIDPWDGNQGVRALERSHGIRYGLEQFRAYTADCPNIRALRAYSPDGVQGWDSPVDLYYEDAVHTDPTLSANIDFWMSKLTANGIICGDDYRPRFPDVRAAAERAAARRGQALHRVDFFWCVLPDPAAVPDARRVASRLRELQAGVLAEMGRLPSKVSVAALAALPERVVAGQDAVARVRAVNDGLPPWPGGSGKPLGLRCRVLDAGGALVAKETRPMGVSTLPFDEPFEAALRVPLADVPPGRYSILCDVVAAEDAEEVLPGAGRLTADLVVAPAEAASPPDFRYDAGETLCFASGGTGRKYQGEGWSRGETRHCWTQGAESSLFLDFDRAADSGPASSWWLRLALRPFIVPGKLPAQRLTILADDIEILSACLSGETELSVRLPIPPGPVTRLRLRLIHPDFRSPAGLMEGSTDQRPLAFAVRTLCVEQVAG